MNQPNARNAIKILSELKNQTNSAHLAYWVTPNTVLTLSGARAYCDGLFYHNDMDVLGTWKREIEVGIEILRTITDVYFADASINNNPRGEGYAGYDLLLNEGLEYTLSRTSIFNNLSTEITKLDSTQTSQYPELSISDSESVLSDRSAAYAAGETEKEIVGTVGSSGIAGISSESSKQKFSQEQLMNTLCGLISHEAQFKEYDEENLKAIAFGTLLGYPDKAIIGSVARWQKYESRQEIEDPFEETLMNADIRGAMYYGCPRPIYDYPRSLVSDPEITEHEQLWSTILKDFYTSDFHKNLADDENFQQKGKDLELI